MALLAVSFVGCKKKSQLADASDPKFKVGQRWSYWARPGEETSTFIIAKIEMHPTLGTVVHVGLDNVQLKGGGKTVGLLPHLPFSRDAIEKSATKKVEDDASMPNYQQGYNAWKQKVDEGLPVTIYTQPIAATLDSLEQEMNAPPPPAK
jgi:hypothetical protein